MIDYKKFLLEETPKLIEKLQENATPKWGLFTAQHMLEHLTWITKVTCKRTDEATTPKETNFTKFIRKGGAIRKTEKGDKTTADLPKLKYETYQEAVIELPKAVNRFYKMFEDNSDFKCLNPIMGELNKAELEGFHYRHFRHHFEQFGLL